MIFRSLRAFAIFMVFVFICLQTDLFKTIQLIQNNNAYHKILSQGTAQLMSNFWVHPTITPNKL